MVEAAFRRLAVMQVRARPVRVGFRLGFAAHVLQVEVFQYDEVVFADEHAGGLVLPVFDDAVRFRVQAVDFPLDFPIRAAGLSHILPYVFAGHVNTMGLAFLPTSYLPVDTFQAMFR